MTFHYGILVGREKAVLLVREKPTRLATAIMRNRGEVIKTTVLFCLDFFFFISK